MKLLMEIATMPKVIYQVVFYEKDLFVLDLKEEGGIEHVTSKVVVNGQRDHKCNLLFDLKRFDRHSVSKWNKGMEKVLANTRCLTLKINLLETCFF